MKKRSRRDASFEIFRYEKLLSRGTAGFAEAIERNRKEIEVAQQHHLQKRRGGEELEVSCERTCGDTI